MHPVRSGQLPCWRQAEQAATARAKQRALPLLHPLPASARSAVPLRQQSEAEAEGEVDMLLQSSSSIACRTAATAAGSETAAEAEAAACSRAHPLQPQQQHRKQ